MTFCLGMKVAGGLVGIADTRVTSGTEVITARKVSVHEHSGQTFFLMTSPASQPKSRSAARLNVSIVPRGSMVTMASTAVSRMARVRASLSR